MSTTLYGRLCTVVLELTDRVQQAIKSLQSSGEPMTLQAISEMVGVSPKGLKYYPQVKMILEQVVK